MGGELPITGDMQAGARQGAPRHGIKADNHHSPDLLGVSQ